MLGGLFLLGLFTSLPFLSLVWYRPFRSISVLSHLGLTASNVSFTCRRTPALDQKLESRELFPVRPVRFTGFKLPLVSTTTRLSAVQRKSGSIFAELS